MEQLPLRGYYLHVRDTSATPISPHTAFFQTSSDRAAHLLCRALAEEFPPPHRFDFQPMDSLRPEELLLYQESIDELFMYDDPDPGVYEPRPEPMTLVRAQLASRAAKLERIVEMLP